MSRPMIAADKAYDTADFVSTPTRPMSRPPTPKPAWRARVRPPDDPGNLFGRKTE